jgi:hypothetical protein
MTNQKIKDHYSDDVRLALLEQSINNINDTLIRFEKRFDQIDSQISNMRSHFDRLIGGLYLIFGTAFVATIIKFVH